MGDSDNANGSLVTCGLVLFNQPAQAMIQIEGLHSTPVASGPMESRSTATLLKDIGMEDDRYASQAGTYSVLGPEPGRQLTLISGEGVRQALEHQGLKCSVVGNLRRNVVLRGISSQDLLNCIGKVLQLGNDNGAKVFVHRNCVPCLYNERKNQIPGLMEALWEAGGVSCEVIQGGTIQVGDVVTIPTSNQGLAVNDGNKPAWFYVRPSQRTATMVKEALDQKKKAHERLKETDPEGVKRAQASFESVGLSFWPKSSRD